MQKCTVLFLCSALRQMGRENSDRRAKYSLDPNNQRAAEDRAEEWEKVANRGDYGIIKSLDIEDFGLVSQSHGIEPDVANVITSTIREYESKEKMYYSDFEFGSFYDETTGRPALFQTTMDGYGRVILNINSSILGNLSLDEINARIAGTKSNLPTSLAEAVVHECGHAKAYARKRPGEVAAMNKALMSEGVKGISTIAESDGAECIAEVEVLLYRGEDVPQEALELYEKYIGKVDVK